MSKRFSIRSLATLVSSGREITWLILYRVVLLISILFGSLFLIFRNESIAEQILYTFTPIALVLGISALSLIYLLKATPGKIFVATQFFIDTILITGIVYLSGGPISPFLFLYLPVVMGAAILISRNGALAVTLLIMSTYGALIWGLNSGTIATFDGSTYIEPPNGGLLIQILGLTCAMALIAIATSYLSLKLEIASEIAAKSLYDIKALSSHHKLLIDGIPEGVIITTTDLIVRSINPAALEMLNINEEITQNCHMSKLLPWFLEANKDIASGYSGVTPPKEIIIEEINRSIIYHSRIIADETGSSRLFIFQDVTELRNIEHQLQMQERMARLLSQQTSLNSVGKAVLKDLVGESQVMKKVFDLINRVSKSDATVLITGESGTGKELVARAIHDASSRNKGSFVAVNCGAIPENLIESELFGHQKGSFTGATTDNIGLFRQADGGSIFLDEIGELPIALQSKMLRVLQEKSVRPVGGTRDIPINVRIIAATNRNLKKEVSEGNFREDLYYRLNVIGVHLPPLRDRKEDIPILINSISANLVGYGKNVTVSPEAMKLLLEYPFPGNVRELENILERALVLGGEVILPEHISDLVRIAKTPSTTTIIEDDSICLPANLEAILSEVERKYIVAALRASNGVKKDAAGLLGVNFRSLRYRLEKFDLES